MALHHVTGDASRPDTTAGPIIIAHVVNNLGKWGKGFTASLDKRWHWLGQGYKDGLAERVAKLGSHGVLGQVMYHQVYASKTSSVELVIAHMVAQKGVSRTGKQVVDYASLARCLRHVRAEALYTGASVHMPRIGSGLGGGDWAFIEQIIIENLVKMPPRNPNISAHNLAVSAPLMLDQGQEVEVYVYTLPTGGA